MLADHFGGRTDNAQDSCFSVKLFQIILLNAAQRFCRCGVTGQNNKRTVLPKQPLYTLQGVTVHCFKAAGTVRRPGIVAEVEIVILRQCIHQRTQHGKAAITGIENTNGRRVQGLKILELKGKPEDGCC